MSSWAQKHILKEQTGRLRLRNNEHNEERKKFEHNEERKKEKDDPEFL